jgi:hypothetical protein
MLDKWLNNWVEDDTLCKKSFIEIKQHLFKKKDTVFDFISRPGISHSLRVAHVNQRNKPLFVMVDAIEDDPRWLSVCFYLEMVTDPKESGDFVPNGLLGEDGICFDLDCYDSKLVGYLKDRIDEAYMHAVNSK